MESDRETVFISERMNRAGRFTPRDTIVLHPYGRYSNAFKFAGEVDVLEALEHALNTTGLMRIALRARVFHGWGRVLANGSSVS